MSYWGGAIKQLNNECVLLIYYVSLELALSNGCYTFIK